MVGMAVVGSDVGSAVLGSSLGEGVRLGVGVGFGVGSVVLGDKVSAWVVAVEATVVGGSDCG